MARFLNRITIVEPGQSRITYKRKGGKRKNSGWLKPLERVSRRWLKSNADFAGDILKRHRRSSKKRRDGWARDLGLNVMKAQRKGLKTLVKA